MTKIIIITGASSGIGKALSLQLAKAGHKVIAVGRNQAALEELKQAEPHFIIPVVADITKAEDREKIKQALSLDDSGVYLVHNAGIATPATLQDMTEDEWDQHYLINTKAPVFLTKLLLPHLKNGGRVLNISTGLAHSTLPGFSAYGVSKAALYMMKEFLNTELSNDDIACGSALPGIVDTPIQDRIRTFSESKFPAVGLFQGFKERNELLTPITAAKFLAWLLLDSEKEAFSKGEWDIYNTEHHQLWAEVGDIKPRSDKPTLK